MHEVTQLERILSTWALGAPEVRRVWIFGSVAKGSTSPRDLDVAVEIEPHGDEEIQLIWSDHASKWRHELQAQLPIKLQLEWFDPAGGTPTISSGLAAGSRLVYERAS